jgi:phosphoglycerol transferase MdoB-like AlkP superfamily enzyme
MGEKVKESLRVYYYFRIILMKSFFLSKKELMDQFFHLQVLVKRLGILLLMYISLQILFYVFNFSAFGRLTFVEAFKIFIGGLRFDVTTIIYYNIPFILLHVLPNPWREKRFYQITLHSLFIVFNYFALALAVSDIEYFKFNNKRLTVDVLGMKDAFLNLFFQFFKDFWFLFLIFLLVVVFVEFFYDKTKVKKSLKLKINYPVQVIVMIVVLAFSVLGARGGLQTIPITPINSTEYASFSNTSLVTNSPYTFIFSFKVRKLEEKHFFDEDSCKRIFSTYHKYDNDAIGKNSNVVIIVLESFSKEFVGALNDYKGYTPFIDSLIGVSKVYPNAYSNANRSCKSIAAIMTGIPPFMDDDIMRSLYQSNCFLGLGTAVKQLGYYTSFYHGGLNGEFNMDRFGYLSGFDHYFGKNEFGNDAYFDGNWGIYDEEFFQYFANQLTEQPEPFCSMIFSLSSHHPFNVPKKYKGKFPKGKVEVLESVGYTDYSLRQFFKTASRMPWFKNTLFIITADHTFGSYDHISNKYGNPTTEYSVPFLLYKSDGSLKGVDSTIVQHVDIMPSVLQYVGYKESFPGFGKSIFSNSENRRSFQYLNNLYEIHDKNFILLFDGKESKGLFDIKNDLKLEHDLTKMYPDVKQSFENEIKAVIQTYNSNMIKNKFCLTEL